MIDASESERDAMRHCLRPFGDAAGRIGFQKPLGEYTEGEALEVIGTIVSAFTEAMVAHHENMKRPSLQCAGTEEGASSLAPDAFHDDPIPF